MDPGATNAAGDSAVLVACQQPESFDQEPFWDEFFGHYCASRPQEIPSLLNKPNSSGETCLHAAAAGQRASLVRNLLFWGAALTARNSRDELPVIQSDWIQDLEANPLLATEEGHRGNERSGKPLSHNGDIIEIVGGPPTREATSQGVPGNISRKNSHRSETERVDGAETQRRQATKQQEETTHPDVICAEGRDQASDSQAAAERKVCLACGFLLQPSTGNHRESAEQPGADLVALDVEALDNEYEQMSIEAEVLRDELKRVKEENARVEKKLAMKFSTTGDFPVYRAQTGDPRLTTQQYFAMLRTLEATKEEKERISALTEEKMQQENQKLATHQEKVEECRTAFR
nr:hypothetical protein TgIb.1310c [Toxoplasma gondii RH]